MAGVRARTAAISGILFAILFTVGLMLTGGLPSDVSDQKAIDYYADSGNRVEAIIGAYALVLSMLCLLPFLAHMRERLASSPRSAPFAPVVFVAGLLFMAMGMAAATAFAWLPAGVTFGSAPAPQNADLARFAPQLGFGLLMVAGGLSAATAFGAAAIGAIRGHIGAAWLGWAGLVVAILQVVAVAFIPLLLLALWVLVVSIVLIVRGPAPAGATAVAA